MSDEEDAFQPFDVKVMVPTVCEGCDKLVSKGQTMTVIAGHIFCDLKCRDRYLEEL